MKRLLGLKKDEMGFTLVELLAVIVIMGILMMVAIPSVTRTIENSRKDTFVDIAKSYGNAARTLWTSDNLTCNGVVSSAVDDGDYYILINSKEGAKESLPVLVDQGGKSSWGNRDVNGYVRVNISTTPGVDDDGDGVFEKEPKRVTKFYVALSDGTHGLVDDDTSTMDELVRGNVNMTLSDSDLKKVELTVDDGRLDCARDANGVYSCTAVTPIKHITGVCVDDQTNVGVTGNVVVPEDNSGISYNIWYRNNSQSISAVAMTSNGVTFFQQGSLVLGYQRNVSINNGILYEGEQVLAEIVDSDNIKFYSYDEYGNVLGSAIYTRDTTQNGNISNYFIIDVAGYIKYAWINNNNMTWQDFINSDSKYNSLTYNGITRNAFYVVNGYVALDWDGIGHIYYNGNKVSLSDTIDNGEIYSVYSGPFEGHCSIDGEGLVFTPLGLTWKQWIESSHNGMYGLTLELDASGYVLYNGKRISTDATGTNLVTCDALMIDGQNYYSVS